MTKKADIRYRRRQEDWQTELFFYAGLPALRFAGLKKSGFVVAEILKPRLRRAHKATHKGVPRLDGAEGIAIFKDVFEGQAGADLENAAAELLLTSGPLGEASDWELFNAWLTHRAQPLDSRLVEAFARFYIERLNEALRQAEDVPLYTRRSHGARIKTG